MALRLKGQTTGYVELAAPASAADNTLTLPNGNGTNGQVLETNGSGVLSFADTVKTNAEQTFSAAQTFNAGLAVDGPYKQAAETVSALDINLSTGNYFKKSISTSSAITFSSPPASGTVGSFTLELVLTGSSTAITWPNGTGGQGTVYWNGDAGTTAPTLVDARTHMFMFVTTDGGTKYRGAVLSDYTG